MVHPSLGVRYRGRTTLTDPDRTQESHSHLSGQAAIPTAYSNVARALKDLYITDNIVIRIRWVRPAAPLWHCRGSLTETKALVLVAPLEPSAFTAADINPYAPIQSPPRTPPFTGA